MKYNGMNNIFNKSMFYFYAAFLFFLPITSGMSKVNNLFHVALAISLILLFARNVTWLELLKTKNFKIGLLLNSIFLIYFSVSAIWSSEPNTIVSELTHSLYIIIFVTLFFLCLIQGRKNFLLTATFFGVLTLLLLSFIYIDKTTLFTNRFQEGFPLAPENVIDMAGYYGIGIFCGLILLRETGKKWLYLPIMLLFFGMFLTQSRGPLLSLIISCAPLLIFKRIRLNHLCIIIISTSAIAAAVIFLNGHQLISRIEMTYSQSFVRFGIWENALSYVQQKPWFGWGFNKELNFVNSIGQTVHTTHSLYFATLLKGGIFGGLLLLSIIGWGLYMGWQQIKAGYALETSMFLFSLIFYLTQGMFLISNPGVSWLMFWLPLAVVLALPERQNHTKN